MAPYHYGPLNPVVREIRLLTLYPSPEHDSPIQGELHAASLTSCGPYNALSYVWGDPHATTQVSIDGCDLNVTLNLDQALRHIRHASQTRIFWIDAVCINQDDLDERSQQVTLMGEIFSRAECVTAWLGEEADDSDLAITMIEKFAGCYLAHVNEGVNPGESVNRIVDAFEPRVWTAISRFIERQWWTRLWIYQEVVLAREVVIVCGNKTVTWTTLHQAWAIWSAMMLPDNAAYLDIQRSGQVTVVLAQANFSPLLYDRVYRMHGTQLSMLSLLRSCIRRCSTDPRDRIYAIMGIAHDASDFGTPDYSKSAEEVLTGFAKELIARDGSLDLLCYARSGLLTPEVGISSGLDFRKLPSWVPHWTWGAETTRMAPQSAHRESTSALTTPPSFRFGPGSELFVHGGIVDRIAHIEPPPFLHPRKHRWISAALQGGADAEYPTGIPRLQALFRLLMADSDPQTGVRLDAVPGSFFNLACAFLFVLPANTAEPRLITAEEVDEAGVPDYMLALRLFLRARGELGNGVAELTDKDMFIKHFGPLSALQEPETDNLRGRRHTKTYSIYETRKTRLCSLFVTEKGYLGLSPSRVHVGDEVAVIPGCSMPLTLRRQGRDFVSVGECFVVGLMEEEEGLALLGNQCSGQGPLEELCLV
ncbi:hypothetical protein OQA88_10226 [Cercophora sp. LCS_1]